MACRYSPVHIYTAVFRTAPPESDSRTCQLHSLQDTETVQTWRVSTNKGKYQLIPDNVRYWKEEAAAMNFIWNVPNRSMCSRLGPQSGTIPQLEDGRTFKRWGLVGDIQVTQRGIRALDRTLAPTSVPSNEGKGFILYTALTGPKSTEQRIMDGGLLNKGLT